MRSLPKTFLLLAAALWSSASVAARAADVKIIANASVKAAAVSVEEIRGVFLVTKTSLSDGSHVEPVLLKTGAAHEAFVKQYLGKTDAGLENYYRSLVFTGRGLMPTTLASDQVVIEYIAKTKGAVGYVSAVMNTPGVKTLEVK
jgi:hypothetical protein